MRSKTVLVVDGGGRGSVLVDKYLQSSYVNRVLAVPGNDMMTLATKNRVKIFPDTKTTDVEKIEIICQKEKVDLIDVAHDDAVAAGLVDSLVGKGFKVLGPTKAAGQIEWDKSWARNFMKKFSIPSPNFKICHSTKEGTDYINGQKEAQWYVKAAGLASGKGALYAKDNSQAVENIKKMSKFKEAGKIYLIEECVEGEEFSSFAIVNGSDFKIIGHAQDHKTVYDGNLGPNTGGMGCSSPPMVITKNIEKQIESIFAKVTNGLVEIKRPYLGILYLGGMIDKKGKVAVIEFNARWGDPEAQVVVPALQNDLYELAILTIDSKLKSLKVKLDNKYRITVAATSRGYPDDYSKVIDKEIYGLNKVLMTKDLKIFGAAVKIEKARNFANGGRLFYITAEGKNVAEARKIAYNALSQVYIEGNNLHYRTDIGYRDLERFYAGRKT